MHQYQTMLRRIMEDGVRRRDRTGTGTQSLFGYQNRYNLAEGFPLVTTKRVPWKAVVGELLWFLRGGSNIKFLHDHGITIWDEWADANGELGPIYGVQWCNWSHAQRIPGTSEYSEHFYDQLSQVASEIRRNPESRRLIVSAWNVGELNQMALPPCHVLFQFYVHDGKLSCQLYQRSADAFLGVPFNIASYALLTHIMAASTGLRVGEFIHTFGDLHLYDNHREQAAQLLARRPRLLPQLRPVPALDPIAYSSLKIRDFVLDGYDPWPTIPAPVAV